MLHKTTRRSLLWMTLLCAACGAPNSTDDSGVAGDDAGASRDAGKTNDDAGLRTDAGNSDAGVDDAGAVDDAGIDDAGVVDSGVEDAGNADAGVDAGADIDAGVGDDGGTSRLFVFTASQGNGQIRTFAFHQDGGLTPLGTIAGGTGTNFLAPDLAHRRLYAVNPGSDEVAAFALNPADAGLTFLNRVGSGGGNPTHVSVDALGDFVMVANYGGGNVSVFPTLPNGGIGAASQTLASGGQSHQIITDKSQHFVYVPCKAADHLAQYSYNAGTLTPLSPPTMATANGAGPRHLAFHPTLSRAYLINEVDSTVQTLSIAPNGTMSSIQTVSTIPAGFAGTNTAAEIAVHPNGRFVFGSNRGHDSIVVWSVNPANGQLTLVGRTPTGGQTPRHFSLDPSGRWLIVPNQGSNSLTLFRVNGTTGALSALGVVATVSTPGFAGFVSFPP